MTLPRWAFTATLLADGKVLAAGGGTSGWEGRTATAEIYDPNSGKWTATAPMNSPRQVHQAVLLGTGKVLVSGGYDLSSILASAEIYDPNSGTWTPTGNMNKSRAGALIALLPNGKVLVAGGATPTEYGTASAELYDPNTGKWSYTGSMLHRRIRNSESPGNIQVLPNGKVLIVGGHLGYPYQWIDNAELYDPSTGSWTSTLSKATHALGAMAFLPDGKMLVAGGRYGSQGWDATITDTEIFDPTSGSWTATAKLPTDMIGPMISLMSGKVLMAGGSHEEWGAGKCGPLRSGFLYDPKTKTWAETPPLVHPRDAHVAIRLINGKVLIAGGNDCSHASLSSVELYTPATELINRPMASVIPISSSAIQIIWSKSTSADVVRIQRKTGTCEASTSWSTRMDIGGNKTTITDTGMKPDTIYSYRIAYYRGSNHSDYSDCVSAMTNLAKTPNMPINLVARSDSDTQVTLTWNDMAVNESGFDIYRRSNLNDWTKLTTVPANVQTYRDTTATGNTATTLYSYHVQACNMAGCSQMNPRFAMVPFKPTNLQVTPGAVIELQWGDGSDNENGFTINRKNGLCSAALPWNAIAYVLINKTTYSDASVIPKTQYAYQVQAFKLTYHPTSKGYSALSDCVDVTVP